MSQPEREIGGTPVLAPMQCKIVEVHVREGQQVAENETVVTIEVMKMEVPIVTPVAGIVRVVKVQAGQSVDADSVLVVVG